jgi:hypothetical protein
MVAAHELIVTIKTADKTKRKRIRFISTFCLSFKISVVQRQLGKNGLLDVKRSSEIFIVMLKGRR